MAVRSTVNSTCTVSATALGFGTYSPSACNTAASTITVACNNDTVATISLDSGQHAGKAVTFGTRALKNGTSYLGYDIFKDSGLTTVWNTTNVQTYTSTGTALAFTAFGSLPASQTGPAGNYTDTVTITATF